MLEIASRRRSQDNESGSAAFPDRSRRLALLREQLLRENRRSAGPFSHPLANRGSLWNLREQIRDVSRIADAVFTNADSATDERLQELCTDLRRLLQTQQRWTERLEDQIWRLESQTALMRRLHHSLLRGSPGTDQIWELCELIARETQAIPDGLLLLPEPGLSIALPTDGVNHLAAFSIEQARFCVFTAMTMMPDVRGADLVASSFHASASRILLQNPPQPSDPTKNPLHSFALQLSAATPRRTLNEESQRLIDVAADFSLHLDQAANETPAPIVPPAVKEFFGPIAARWSSSQHLEEARAQMARSFCKALGLGDIATADSLNTEQHAGGHNDDEADERLVLSHKLRWHQPEREFGTNGPTPAPHGKRLRRPNFLKPATESPRLYVFAD